MDFFKDDLLAFSIGVAVGSLLYIIWWHREPEVSIWWRAVVLITCGVILGSGSIFASYSEAAPSFATVLVTFFAAGICAAQVVVLAVMKSRY